MKASEVVARVAEAHGFTVAEMRGRTFADDLLVDARAEAAARLYRAGGSIVQVARALRKDWGTVAKLLDRAGVPRRVPPPRPKPIPRAEAATAPRANQRVFADILAQVAYRHGLTVEELEGPCREARFVSARVEAVAALRRGELSMGEIGKLLGGRHHTTIMHLEQLARLRGLLR